MDEQKRREVQSREMGEKRIVTIRKMKREREREVYGSYSSTEVVHNPRMVIESG